MKHYELTLKFLVLALAFALIHLASAQCTSGNCELPLLEPNLQLSWGVTARKDMDGATWSTGSLDLFSTTHHGLTYDKDRGIYYVGLGSGIGVVCHTSFRPF